MRMPRTHRHARVEMLPLMDVVFLILVFLIYAMMVMVVHMGMPVALPTSKNAQPEQIVVLALTIRQDGALWLDKDPVTLETLPGEVMRQSRERGRRPMTRNRHCRFSRTPMLPYQKLFDVLDALKKAGLKKISLQAKEGG